jgi:hypothetical protein
MRARRGLRACECDWTALEGRARARTPIGAGASIECARATLEQPFSNDAHTEARFCCKSLRRHGGSAQGQRAGTSKVRLIYRGSANSRAERACAECERAITHVGSSRSLSSRDAPARFETTVEGRTSGPAGSPPRSLGCTCFTCYPHNARR